MKAVVFEQAKAPLEVCDIDLPPLGRQQVRVKVGASGVSHSDHNLQQGLYFPRGPIVAGHEGAGSQVILILRRMPGFDDLSGCHAGTSPRSKYDLQGRLTLIAWKGRSPISRNAPRMYRTSGDPAAGTSARARMC